MTESITKSREFSWALTEAFGNQGTPFTAVWRGEQDGIKMTSGTVWSGTLRRRKIQMRP